MRLSSYVPGDLKDILEYVSKDSARNAERLVRVLYERCHELADIQSFIDCGLS